MNSDGSTDEAMNTSVRKLLIYQFHAKARVLLIFFENHEPTFLNVIRPSSGRGQPSGENSLKVYCRA
ncbi:unnamed protein product [Sphenostylis stenocarpa]|uniref:Uncharacterized protein n=1 Tax=Sphenostylis stenocarpa TaxID=92480 RepID=A0AA86T329_9FABA|nr:unnamed protein product [Sphenostylis stenocarpa]